MRIGFSIIFAVAIGASCATAPREAPVVAPPAAIDPRTCVVRIFPGTPPFEVQDLGPIQSACSGQLGHLAACGIDQPNLAQIACSSGADTVFGVFEEVRPSQGGPLSSEERVIHARLGRRLAAVRPPSPAGGAQ